MFYKKIPKRKTEDVNQRKKGNTITKKKRTRAA
jgi:hypothetical protein